MSESNNDPVFFCPYNAYHKFFNNRKWVFHIERCGDRKGKSVYKCQFNTNHIFCDIPTLIDHEKNHCQYKDNQKMRFDIYNPITAENRLPYQVFCKYDVSHAFNSIDDCEEHMEICPKKSEFDKKAQECHEKFTKNKRWIKAAQQAKRCKEKAIGGNINAPDSKEMPNLRYQYMMNEPFVGGVNKTVASSLDANVHKRYVAYDIDVKEDFDDYYKQQEKVIKKQQHVQVESNTIPNQAQNDDQVCPPEVQKKDKGGWEQKQSSPIQEDPIDECFKRNFPDINETKNNASNEKSLDPFKEAMIKSTKEFQNSKITEQQNHKNLEQIDSSSRQPVEFHKNEVHPSGPLAHVLQNISSISNDQNCQTDREYDNLFTQSREKAYDVQDTLEQQKNYENYESADFISNGMKQRQYQKSGRERKINRKNKRKILDHLEKENKGINLNEDKNSLEISDVQKEKRIHLPEINQIQPRITSQNYNKKDEIPRPPADKQFMEFRARLLSRQNQQIVHKKSSAAVIDLTIVDSDSETFW